MTLRMPLRQTQRAYFFNFKKEKSNLDVSAILGKCPIEKNFRVIKKDLYFQAFFYHPIKIVKLHYLFT